MCFLNSFVYFLFLNFNYGLLSKINMDGWMDGIRPYENYFRRTLLRFVRLMSSQIRLLSDCHSLCRLSETMVHCTQTVDLFGNILAPHLA